MCFTVQYTSAIIQAPASIETKSSQVKSILFKLTQNINLLIKISAFKVKIKDCEG